MTMRPCVVLTVMVLLSGLRPSAAWPSERPRSFVDLVYPAEALAARVTGAVVVRVQTDASGRVVEAEPLSGPAALRPSVVANIKRWTLAPGAHTDTLVYRFEIDHGFCNDDSQSLFRLVQPNLAVITACSAPGRAAVPVPTDDMLIVSRGDPPMYPTLARNARVTGVVVLELSIDGSGAVTDSHALNEIPLLSQAAVAYSKTWRISTTAPRRGTVIYEFALDAQACTLESRAALWKVTADYLRLSACEPPVNP